MLKKLYETQPHVQFFRQHSYIHIKLTYIGLKVLQNATLTCPVNAFRKRKKLYFK